MRSRSKLSLTARVFWTLGVVSVLMATVAVRTFRGLGLGHVSTVRHWPDRSGKTEDLTHVWPRTMGIRKLGRVFLAAAVVTSAGTAGLIGLPATFGGFTAAKANPANSASAGTLQITNTAVGAAINVSNALPGTNSSKTLTITNSGSLPATETLVFSNISYSPSLSGVLTVSVQDTTTGSYVVGSAGSPVAINLVSTSGYALPGSPGPSQWAKAEAHTFQITVSLPSSAPNGAQGASASFDLTWSATS